MEHTDDPHAWRARRSAPGDAIMHVFSRPSDRSTRSRWTRRVRLPVAIAWTTAIVLVAACASSSASGTGTGPKPSPSLITADEISRVNVVNAFEVVQKLRPSMLRQRQVATAN
ncbi:MAG TPA: hypothetical protein VD758_10415, partial [Gemmatimonadaceae bacterium]|nr:hypothetical protein [Gemmatimonadaceae bacterium]